MTLVGGMAPCPWLCMFSGPVSHRPFLPSLGAFGAPFLAAAVDAQQSRDVWCWAGVLVGHRGMGSSGRAGLLFLSLTKHSLFLTLWSSPADTPAPPRSISFSISVSLFHQSLFPKDPEPLEMHQSFYSLPL